MNFNKVPLFICCILISDTYHNVLQDHNPFSASKIYMSTTYFSILLVVHYQYFKSFKLIKHYTV